MNKTERVKNRIEKIFDVSYSNGDIKRERRRDRIILLTVFVVVTASSVIFRGMVQNPDLDITMFFILGNFIVACYTHGYSYGFIYAGLSVLTINIIFTYPYNNLNLSLQGYPVTFAAMLIVSMATSGMTTKMKKQAKILQEQEKALMDAEKERMRANLLRAVSHDVRTPLTGIIGNSDTYLSMEDTLSEEEKRDIVANIRTDSTWLLNMVENLLTVTRIDNETAAVNKTLESVEDVVSSAVVRFKKRYPQAHVKIFLPDEPAMAMMDPMLIEQVIINILQNAQVHSGSEKPLELAVTVAEDRVYLSIKDYGVGIDEDKLANIFDGDGSYKSENNFDSYKGMGIGLSICKTIIAAHGGDIEAENHGEGTTFTFFLPKEKEEQE